MSGPPSEAVQLVTDRRRVMLGGGLLLGFAVVSTKRTLLTSCTVFS